MAKFMGQGEAAASSVVIAVQHDESDVIGMLNKNTGGAVAEWFDCNVDAEVAFDESDEIGDATDTGGCRRQHFAGELACAGFGSRCWVVEPTWSGTTVETKFVGDAIELEQFARPTEGGVDVARADACRGGKARCSAGHAKQGPRGGAQRFGENRQFKAVEPTLAGLDFRHDGGANAECIGERGLGDSFGNAGRSDALANLVVAAGPAFVGHAMEITTSCDFRNLVRELSQVVGVRFLAGQMVSRR